MIQIYFCYRVRIDEAYRPEKILGKCESNNLVSSLQLLKSAIFLKKGKQNTSRKQLLVSESLTKAETTDIQKWTPVTDEAIDNM